MCDSYADNYNFSLFLYNSFVIDAAAIKSSLHGRKSFVGITGHAALLPSSS